MEEISKRQQELLSLDCSRSSAELWQPPRTLASWWRGDKGEPRIWMCLSLPRSRTGFINEVWFCGQPIRLSPWQIRLAEIVFLPSHLNIGYEDFSVLSQCAASECVWESSDPCWFDLIPAFGTQDPRDAGVYRVPTKLCAHIVRTPYNLPADTKSVLLESAHLCLERNRKKALRGWSRKRNWAFGFKRLSPYHFPGQYREWLKLA